MNKIKQHSPLWRTLKAHYLGANDCASILGHGFNTVDEIIKFKTERQTPVFTPEQQARMNHGTRFESLVRDACAQRNEIEIKETGMRFHKRLTFLTASPDGLYIDGNGEHVLTEFKVLSSLNMGIPYKYWIQTQIQMQVWGINRCMYCENVVTEDGVIKEYREQMIEADREWFAKVEPLLVAAWTNIETTRRLVRKRKHTPESPKPEIYAHNLVNYVRKDPILDWLELYGQCEPVKAGTYTKMISRLKNEFTSRVRSHIKTMYEHLPGFTTDIDLLPATATCIPDGICVNTETVARTREAMAAGTPIIFNAAFQVEEESHIIKGTADMLVLNHYLDSIFNVKDGQESPDKYSIVQFKFANMDLRADGRTLLNNDKQKAYKAQTWFVNKLLGNVQGFTPNTSYIIGRRYVSSKFKCNNAFGKLVVVNHEDDDDTHLKALDWAIAVRTDNSWRTVNPVNCTYLYPNMKNHHDDPWRGYKLNLAKQINDITLMYRCGPNVRQRANEQGITTWPELGDQGFKADIINDFIAAQTEVPGTRRAPIPHHLIRFYMDFESTGSFYDDFSTFPESADNNFIFLIGVFAEDTVTGETKYFSYVAEHLDNQSEQEILTRMFTDLRQFRDAHAPESSIPLYYWSNAEKYMLERSLVEVPADVEMVDLCKIFQKSRVIMPGQFGFGLKEIGTLMKKYGLIQTCWDSTQDISNGMDAMVEAIRTYKFRQQPKAISEFYQEVVKYNYVDCKIMQEIVNAVKQ